MAGLARITKAIQVANKAKKHGVKAGQKSLVRPSQKKSVKNGRHQEKETPKTKVAKTVAAIPADLDGEILDDAEDLDYEVFGDIFEDESEPDLDDES